MNYSGKAIAELTVRIDGVSSAKTVRSVERGPLAHRIVDGALEVRLPLAVADMILVDR